MPATFLSKLRTILSDTERHGDCISWCMEGCGIQILDEDKFTRTALWEYYEHTSFVSFVRQLNVYGFKKTRRTLEERVYYHPKFNIHEPHLETSIRRKPRRRNKDSPSPSTSPTKRNSFTIRRTHIDSSAPRQQKQKLPSIHTFFPKHFHHS